MPPRQATIRVHQDETALTFRVAGRATMQQAPEFVACAQEAIEAATPAVRVDLRECSYMDSTFLGALLSLRRSVIQRPTRFELIDPSPDCRRLLEQMGLDAFLPVAPTPPEPAGPWHEIEDHGLAAASDAGRAAALQETVVRAHQELADTPTPGCAQFKSIAAKLAQSWEKQKGPSS